MEEATEVELVRRLDIVSLRGHASVGDRDGERLERREPGLLDSPALC